MEDQGERGVLNRVARRPNPVWNWLPSIRWNHKELGVFFYYCCFVFLVLDGNVDCWVMGWYNLWGWASHVVPLIFLPTSTHRRERIVIGWSRPGSSNGLGERSPREASQHPEISEKNWLWSSGGISVKHDMITWSEERQNIIMYCQLNTDNAKKWWTGELAEFWAIS